jgi:hypothetical protein
VYDLRMKTDCVEIRVVTSVDPGELIGRLHEEEPLGAWQDGNILHLFWPEK